MTCWDHVNTCILCLNVCVCIKNISKQGFGTKKLTIIFSTLEDVEENDDCILDVDILSSVKKVKTGKYICNTKWGDLFCVGLLQLSDCINPYESVF
jgi:hypothetical protein